MHWEIEQELTEIDLEKEKILSTSKEGNQADVQFNPLTPLESSQ